jgi:hypothetical protein
MFSIFRRSKDSTFNIAAIGNNWLRRPIVHEGKAGSLHVRQIPTDVKRSEYPFVALAQCESVAPETIEARTIAVQRALERDGACLLVLTHAAPGAVTWYAYASTQKALDAAFASLSDPSIRWGGGEDKGWKEFEHARGLVGA